VPGCVLGVVVHELERRQTLGHRECNLLASLLFQDAFTASSGASCATSGMSPILKKNQTQGQNL
jgi:hypothetical protein